MAAVLSEFQFPSRPVIAAGSLGGPFVIYLSTPVRNALTLAATNKSLSIAQCYTQAFAKAFRGGHVYATAACPQFVCLGPAYHAYASVFGSGASVLLTAITEALIVHGAERKNAQLSVSMKGRMQSAYNPFGAGLGLHVLRNGIAMSGIRVLSDPMTRMFETVTGTRSSWTTVAGDISANIVSASLSLPFHQLWNYSVVTPALWEASRSEQLQMMKKYLQNQYLTSTGRISSVVLRDSFLRSVYCAFCYTTYVNIERSFIAHWPKS